ncbi:Ppx/GppA family phosphatase [Pararhodospirillum photometricum]|nr:Ppx/GppA family phosphatase [Pararhodospirillum photometricum]
MATCFSPTPPVTTASVLEAEAPPLGVVDIGSNSVRLVVYRGTGRTPLPLLNEKATCGLGRGLGASELLNPEGKGLALAAVSRYARLAEAMGVGTLDLVATAAIRDAWDGPAFVAEIEAATGHPVTVLSGEDEARMAALGVLCGLPDANGMVADLGGGSLELVMVHDGHFDQYTTMPLGVLRLSEASGNDRARACEIIDDHLLRLPWLSQCRGRSLYAVGGAWRTLARVCIEQIGYPLHVLDNFSLPYDEALRLFDLIARLPRKALEGIDGISRKRVPHLTIATVLLERLLQEARPDHLVFSVYGMREGRFFQTLPPEVQTQDPLISACEALARAAGRFPGQGRELFAWMAPLFLGESQRDSRLRLATCLIGDVFWSEHPDYRADQAFHRVLKMPFMGLSHTDRACLALAVRHRYTSDPGDDWVDRAEKLLDSATLSRVRTIGHALRLGYAVSGGAPGLISRTALTLQDGALTLHVPGHDPIYQPEVFAKRLERLARGLGVSPRTVTLA